MKKFLAFTLLPLTFAIFGVFSHEVFQRIPKGEWKLQMGNDYQSYNLDSLPKQILDLDVYSNLYLRTESGKEYSCTHFEVFCEESKDLNKIDKGGIKIIRDIKFYEFPEFDGNISDIVLFTVPMHETLGYIYYVIASDGSIWRWGRGDNLYEDFFGWAGLGCLGLIIGIALASWLVNKKKKEI